MSNHGRKSGTAALALVLAALALVGCGGKSTVVPKGQTLHAQQVLERYDANGDPVPQYLEIWAAPPQALCHELSEDGATVAVALDNADGHVRYDAKTLKASRQDAPAVFHVDFAALKAAARSAKAIGKLQYAGRDCIAWQLDADSEDTAIKLYVDAQTGWVLFCDAPTFRLRTAKLDFVQTDESRFATPAGLKMQ
jgi:hypothetical protein